ncbi:MAG: 3-phosphoshikimate 1-carboxyvinyltransferase [Niabella sp.]
MQHINIYPSQLSGNIQAPASKSSMQRACAAALLSLNKTTIYNPGHSNDDKAALSIIQSLGAFITNKNDDVITITSNFLSDVKNIIATNNHIHCGESGLSIRMFTPIAALCKNEINITGEGSLTTRPLNFFDTIFPQLGIKVQSNNGKLPITIQGSLLPKDIEIDGSLSSQFLTGLLFAFAVAPHQNSSETVSIRVNNLKSKPYIDLTLNVMKQFGLPLPENKDYKEFIFYKKDKEYFYQNKTAKEITYTVEGDWSGGAFLLVAGAIAGPITVTGLSLSSTQADKKIVDALMAANAGIAMEAKGIKIHPAPMQAFEFDATDCPDLFPPLVALAAYCNGTTSIKGVSRLAHKESNRGLTLQEEFGKMGIKIELDDDIMRVHGGTIKGNKVHSRHDHRIAMACAVAALKAEGITHIEEAGAINKSYPDFYIHLQQLGVKVDTGLDIESIKKAFLAAQNNH